MSAETCHLLVFLEIRKTSYGRRYGMVFARRDTLQTRVLGREELALGTLACTPPFGL